MSPIRSPRSGSAGAACRSSLAIVNDSCARVRRGPSVRQSRGWSAQRVGNGELCFRCCSIPGCASVRRCRSSARGSGRSPGSSSFRTRNSSARHVAISDRAYAGLLELIDREPADSKVFRFSSWVAENAWRNEIRITAQCPDLRIHDLRHEALSRMSARGADLKTLMRQSGHKTVAVLMRYLNPTPAEQRSRLFRRTPSLKRRLDGWIVPEAWRPAVNAAAEA
ncbi:tyrosine-type recombinase/integrase [Rhodopseudomonas parapalustris]